VDDDWAVVTLHLAWCFGKTFNKFRRSKLMISMISLGWLKSNGFVCMALQALLSQWPGHDAFNGEAQ